MRYALGGGDKREAKREIYLCTTRSVLRSSAGYELCVVVLEQIFVETHVLVFCKYGIVGFETVFGEHCFITRHAQSDFLQAVGWHVCSYPWPWISKRLLSQPLIWLTGCGALTEQWVF